MKGCRALMLPPLSWFEASWQGLTVNKQHSFILLVASPGQALRRWGDAIFSCDVSQTAAACQPTAYPGTAEGSNGVGHIIGTMRERHTARAEDLQVLVDLRHMNAHGTVKGKPE